MDEIVNRVSSSALVTIDLEEFYPKGERVLFDITPWLYQELMLKETDFRAYIKEHNWEQYSGKNVAIHCSADAIVPIWAFMLVMTKLEPHVNFALFGDLDRLEQGLFQKALSGIIVENYQNAKVVVKGCGNLPIPIMAYTELTRILTPVVQSIMYGEPCSTVPIFKNLKK